MSKGKHTREPNVAAYRPLESDIQGDDEFYVYHDTANGLEYVRKKVGAWINVSKFYPLLQQRNFNVDQIEQELVTNVRKQHRMRATKNERYLGLWISLRDARKFASIYGIEDIVSPILVFERIALVSYSGLHFWEFFATVFVDFNVRVLREANSSKVNMRHIFVVYEKYKPDIAPLQRRHFYNTCRAEKPDLIAEKNDPTLCGGSWIPHRTVFEYCEEHKFLNKLRPILDFSQSPDEAEEFPIDITQAYQRRYWRTTTCQEEFFGYPKTFGGGHAPIRPSSKSAVFSVDDLVEKKSVVTDVTQLHQSTKYRVQLVKRKSDGWLNGSLLVKLGCLLKVKELDFGKDDPVMVTLNELYFRDVLQALDCEPVTSSRAGSSLNGFWCSGRDARALFKSLMIERLTLFQSVNQWLEQTDYEPEDDDDDDDIDMLNENEFVNGTSKSRRKTIKKEDKSSDFFVAPDSSEEESVAGFDSDDDLAQVASDGQRIYEVFDDDDEDDDHASLFEEPFDNEIKDEFSEQIPQKEYQQSTPANFSQFQQHPGHNIHQYPQQNVTQQQQQGYYQQQQQQQQQHSQIQNQDAQTRSKIIQDFKAIKKRMDAFIQQRNPNAAESKKIVKIIEELEDYNAIDSEILTTSMLGQTLQQFKTRFNVHAIKIDALMNNWKTQTTDRHPSHQSAGSNPAFSRRNVSQDSGYSHANRSPNMANQYLQQQPHQYQQSYQQQPEAVNAAQQHQGAPKFYPRFPEQQQQQQQRPQQRNNRRFPEAPVYPYGSYGATKPAPSQAPSQANQQPNKFTPSGQSMPQSTTQRPLQYPQIFPQQGNFPQDSVPLNNSRGTGYPTQNFPLGSSQPGVNPNARPRIVSGGASHLQNPQLSTSSGPTNPKSAIGSNYKRQEKESNYYQSSQQYPSYSKQGIAQGKRARERISTYNNYEPSRDRDHKQQKLSSTARSPKSSTVAGASGSQMEYRPYRAETRPNFNFQMQKLINEDDTHYQHLKQLTGRDDAATEQEVPRDEFINISDGNELTNAIFNNESVKKFRKLVHFKDLAQRRHDLLKKRRILFGGLSGEQDCNNTATTADNGVDFSKRLDLMVAEREVRKRG